LLDLSAVLIGLISLLAVVNARVLRMPPTIGITIGALLVSLILMGLARLDVPVAVNAVDTVQTIDFDEVVFLGVLSFLLFAGALGLDSHELWALRWPVFVFALLSTALSTAAVGGLIYLLLGAFGQPVALVYCLLFGALISPTDPVAVLGMLKHAKVPNRIETIVAGESLFNDGVGVVAFTVLAAVATAGSGAGHAVELTVPSVSMFFLREAVGGVVLGLVMGYVGLRLIRAVPDYVTEVLVSLGIVAVLTAVAFHLTVSAPLAAVAGGLLVGSLTDRTPSTLSNREQFEGFWHLVDELLNVFLFALLAFEVVWLHLSLTSALLGLIAIPLVLAVRTMSVQVPMVFLRRSHVFDPYTRRLMIWGGLRGALGVAMAFTLPDGAPRDLFLVMTYAVVMFSIVVQGLTIGRLAERASAAAEPV
jgi:CPA1 family monovalent cation:H+ antiporter